jgi:hypothetical protein
MNILAVYKHTVMRHCFPIFEESLVWGSLLFLILLLVATVHVKKRQEKIMRTVNFEYNTEKYNLTKFLDNKKLLSRAVWFDHTKESSERKTLNIVRIKGNMATCAFIDYDKNISKFVEMTGEFPVENIQLQRSEAVNIEYEKILSQLDEEAAAILRGLVWEKEQDAAVAGYNGCI